MLPFLHELFLYFVWMNVFLEMFLWLQSNGKSFIYNFPLKQNKLFFNITKEKEKYLYFFSEYALLWPLSDMKIFYTPKMFLLLNNCCWVHYQQMNTLERICLNDLFNANAVLLLTSLLCRLLADPSWCNSTHKQNSAKNHKFLTNAMMQFKYLLIFKIPMNLCYVF